MMVSKLEYENRFKTYMNRPTKLSKA